MTTVLKHIHIMKARYTLLFLTMLSVWTNAIAQVPFASLIGEEAQSYSEEVHQSVPTSDGGVIATIGIGQDIFLMKLDPDGQPLWAYAYSTGSSAPSLPLDLVSSSDGGAFIALQTGVTSPWNLFPFLVIARIDGNGIATWSKRYRMPVLVSTDNPSFRTTMLPLENGDLQVTIYDGPIGPGGGAAAHTVRLDGNGTIQWAQREVLGLGADRGIVREGDDGGITFMQMSHFDGHFIRLTRFSGAGAPLWSKQLRMTNASWGCYPGSFLLTASGDSYIVGEQSAGMLEYPFLIKVSPSGGLDWYRLYGDGTGSEIHTLNDHAAQLPNTDLQFGLLSPSTFTVDGEHVSTQYRHTPSWTAGAFTHAFLIHTYPAGQSDALVFGSLERFDNTFSTTWTTPYLSRMDLTASLNCGWTQTTRPLSSDTIVPSEFIEYQEGTAWESIAVDVADTAVIAMPMSIPTIAHYCAPVGLDEQHQEQGELTLFPSMVGSGSLVNVRTRASGQLSVFDATGRAVRTLRVPVASTTELGTEGLASGVYTVRLIHDLGGGLSSARFVIE